MYISKQSYYKAMARALLRGYFEGLKQNKKYLRHKHKK
mgnify:CR=1 FL=1